MKRLTVLWIGLLFAGLSFAQIPYFAGTVGDGRLYGYTSVKFRPGLNHQETYSTFQYGLGNHFAAGIDLYTGPVAPIGASSGAMDTASASGST